MRPTIENLSNGLAAINHVGDESKKEMLNEILKMAFPDDNFTPDGWGKYYYKDKVTKGEFNLYSTTTLPSFTTQGFYDEMNKTYTLKDECKSYFSKDEQSKTKTHKDWGLPLTMLDEVKKIEVTNVKSETKVMPKENKFNFTFQCTVLNSKLTK